MTDDLEIKSNPPVDRLDPAPDHWKWTRLSHIVHFGHGADPNQVEVDSPGYPVYGSGGQFKWASEWLYDGPSVLFGRKGTVDRPIFVDGKFWTVDTMFYTVINERVIVPRFLFYWATRLPFDYYATGTALPSMTQTDLGSEHIAVPPLSEQKRIADYLDHETAEIDAFISELEQFSRLSKSRWTRSRNELLFGLHQPGDRYSDERYTWFPEFPRRFREGSFKHYFEVTLGKMLDEKKNNSSAKRFAYIRAANIGDGSLELRELNSMPFTESERSKFSIRRNDLLIVEGGSVGTNVVISQDLPDIFYQKTVNRARPRPGVDPHYFSEVLNAYRERGVFDVIGNGSTIMHLTAEKLNSLIVPVPPSDVQENIASHLRTARADYALLQEEIQRAIDLSFERRAALITAAVTGQIDVTAKYTPVAEQLEAEIAEAR